MYLLQNPVAKDEDSDKSNHSGESFDKKVFVYCDEVLDKKIYPSSEEE